MEASTSTFWFQGIICRVPTGQGKLEKVWEFEWSGKGQGKIFFWKSQEKVRENEMLQLVKDLLSRFVKRDAIDNRFTGDM